MGTTRLKEEGMTEKRTPERVKIKTTMRPDQELEVSHQEALDLERQGLLVKDTKKGERA